MTYEARGEMTTRDGVKVTVQRNTGGSYTIILGRREIWFTAEEWRAFKALCFGIHPPLKKVEGIRFADLLPTLTQEFSLIAPHADLLIAQVERPVHKEVAFLKVLNHPRIKVTRTSVNTFSYEEDLFTIEEMEN